MKDYDTETQAVPSLDRLSAEGEEAIHEAAMHIIENVGVKMNHDRALEVLADNGGEIHDDNVVTMPREVVEEAAAEAPSSFTLHARNSDNDVTIGEGSSTPLRAPGYGPPNIRTFEDGRRKSQVEDYETLLKLVQTEDVLTSTGYNVCEPNDVDQEVKHLEMVKRSLSLTDKVPMVSPYGADRTQANLDMVGAAVDDPDLSKPYAAGLVNTVPPRSLDTKMLGGLVTLAENGQPPVVSSFTMAGASGPATIAGSLAQANAENLMGITLAQLINPGTPVVYGVPSSNIDVRYGSLSIGSPESALFISFAGQMGRYYGIPSRAGGSLTDSKTVDYQGGFESMLTLSAAEFAGIDFMLHSCGILESYSTISPEKLVLDCEMIRYLDRFKDGFAIDEESFAFDLMESVEPAGHFLSERHTLTHSKTELYRSDVVDKRSHGDWEEDGAKSAFEMGHDRVQNRLDAYEEPELDEDIKRELDAYVEEASKTAY
ncbi:trimethylamine methyltransferase family protein [Halobacteriaceae archaeon GCM10025711]